MDTPDDELDGLDAETARRVRFVAEYCAMMDVNAGIGQFKGMPAWAQRDYLHDARNAVAAMAEYDKRGGADIEDLRVSIRT